MKKIIRKIPGRTEVYYKLEPLDFLTKVDIKVVNRKNPVHMLMFTIDRFFRLTLRDVSILVNREWILGQSFIFGLSHDEDWYITLKGVK